MKIVQYIKQLDKLQVDALKQVQVLADNIRNNVIIPYCEKHSLDFTTGMGCCFFTTLEGEHLEPSELSSKLHTLLMSDMLGVWIADYIESYNSTQGHYATHTMQYSNQDKPIGI